MPLQPWPENINLQQQAKVSDASHSTGKMRSTGILYEGLGFRAGVQQSITLISPENTWQREQGRMER